MCTICLCKKNKNFPAFSSFSFSGPDHRLRAVGSVRAGNRHIPLSCSLVSCLCLDTLQLFIYPDSPKQIKLKLKNIHNRYSSVLSLEHRSHRPSSEGHAEQDPKWPLWTRPSFKREIGWVHSFSVSLSLTGTRSQTAFVFSTMRANVTAALWGRRPGRGGVWSG